MIAAFGVSVDEIRNYDACNAPHKVAWSMRMRIRASDSATSRRSFVERNTLAAERKLRELCLDNVVGKIGDIVEACSKDTDDK